MDNPFLPLTPERAYHEAGALYRGAFKMQAELRATNELTPRAEAAASKLIAELSDAFLAAEAALEASKVAESYANIGQL